MQNEAASSSDNPQPAGNASEPFTRVPWVILVRDLAKAVESIEADGKGGVRLTAVPGVNIHDALASAISLATVIGKPVSLRCNGYEVTAKETSTIAALYEQYQDAQRRRSEELERLPGFQESRKRDGERRAAAERERERLMLELDDALKDQRRLIAWLGAYTTAAGTARSPQDQALLIALRLREAGYVAVALENFVDKHHSASAYARWLVWQAIASIDLYGFIHPAIADYAQEHGRLFPDSSGQGTND